MRHSMRRLDKAKSIQAQSVGGRYLVQSQWKQEHTPIFDATLDAVPGLAA